jgi:hypothetical protein
MTEANKFIGNIMKLKKNEEIVEDKIIIDLIKYHPTKTIDIINLDNCWSWINYCFLNFHFYLVFFFFSFSFELSILSSKII